MKEMLYAALDSMPNPMDRERQLQQSKSDSKSAEDKKVTIESDINYQEYVQRFDEQFLDFCQQELTKINSFFAEKLAEATRKFGDLKKELNSILPGIKRPNSPFTVLHRTPTTASATGSGTIHDRTRSRID